MKYNSRDWGDEIFSCNLWINGNGMNFPKIHKASWGAPRWAATPDMNQVRYY